MNAGIGAVACASGVMVLALYIPTDRWVAVQAGIGLLLLAGLPLRRWAQSPLVLALLRVQGLALAGSVVAVVVALADALIGPRAGRVRITITFGLITLLLSYTVRHFLDLAPWPRPAAPAIRHIALAAFATGALLELLVVAFILAR